MSDGDKQQKNTEGLKPKWKKGESGNPNGRPRSGFALADLFRKVAEETDDEGVTRRERIIRKIMEKAEYGNLNAAEMYFLREFGKVPDKVLTGELDKDEIQVIE